MQKNLDAETLRDGLAQMKYRGAFTLPKFQLELDVTMPLRLTI